MSTLVNYETMKVGQLRALCKLRGLNSDERKEELIISLIRSDNASAKATEANEANEASPTDMPRTEILNAEELREVATITDEMRHLRKQWLAQVSKHGGHTQGSQSFVHQGYGTSRK